MPAVTVASGRAAPRDPGIPVITRIAMHGVIPSEREAVSPWHACLRWFALVLLMIVAGIATAAPATAAAPPRIGVVTMLPGEIFFERFGHDAVVVHDPATGRATSYNFGFFDPTEDDFISRFVRGEMRYRLAAVPFDEDLLYYDRTGRGASIQWLDLPPERARAVADALEINARPENAHYRYDYFLDNCATRVRDAVDLALGGDLRRQLEGRSRGLTYRSEATRLASPAPWMWLAFDVGLGPAADRPLSMWEEAFVPMRLADALAGVRGDDGRPVVASVQPLLPHRLAPEPGESQPWWPAWAGVGLAFGIAAVLAARRWPRALVAIALPWWGLCALLGALMLFIWFGTAHRFGWANHNLLLFNPLCLLLLPGGWAIARGRRAGRVFGIVLIAVAAGAVLALFMHWLPVLPQRNAHWIALVLPLHLGLAIGLLAPRAIGLARAGHA